MKKIKNLTWEELTKVCNRNISLEGETIKSIED